MSADTKRHLISAGITFASAFAFAVLPIITEPSWAYAGKATIFALLLAGVRAGAKAVWEKWGPVLQS